MGWSGGPTMRTSATGGGGKRSRALALLGVIGAFASLAAPGPAAELRPLVTVGTQVPGVAGATLLELGETFVLDRETFAFWARIGSGEHDFALLGARGGQFELLGLDVFGERGARSKNPLSLPGTVAVLNERDRVVVAGDRVLIGEQGVPEGRLTRTLSVSGDRAVWSWGADGLRRLLGAGDRLALGAKSFTVAGARLNNANRAGTALLGIGFSDPPKGSGLATFDRDGLRLFAVMDEAVPGRSGEVFVSKGMFCPGLGGYLDETSGVFAFVCVGAPGSKQKPALWHLTREAARRLLATGDPFPWPGYERWKVDHITVLAAQSAERFVVSVQSSSWASYTKVLIRSDGNWFEPFEEVVASKDSYRGLAYLSAISPQLAYAVGDEFRTTEDYGSFSRQGIMTLRGLARFDGQKVWPLLPEKGLDPLAVCAVPPGGIHSGWIVSAWSDPFAGMDIQIEGGPPGLLEELRRPKVRSYFVDGADPAAGLQAPPTVATVGGTAISLDEVEQWFGEGAALVKRTGSNESGEALAGGLYLLELGPAPSGGSSR